MDYKEIESKWKKYWDEKEVYKFDKDKVDKKYYLLEMFSYPSGAKLHLGHWWNYGLSDSFGRFKRMQGYEVFQPMGFDAFGLPAENYAIKTGVHPSDSTHKNIEVMEEQLKQMGATFDWNYEIKTCDEDYYKWTQWLFLKLYEKGLVYQKYAPVNWCPSCNTVLANEQVVDGKCERCDSVIVHKKLTQWFIKITDYAERLLDHSKLDWPEKTISLQKNWIDKSVGSEIVLKIDGQDGEIKAFTTRLDTLFGVSFVVVAPEHPMLEKLVVASQKDAVEKYIQESIKKSEIERTSTATEKTGVFTGSYVLNPLTKEKIPVFVGDYVIGSYGTGAVIGVGAHDTRDYDFAKRFNLPIKRVIESKDGKETELPFTEKGRLINSAEFDGQTSDEAILNIVEKLEKLGLGNKKVNYRLRDWSVSRQRYWGCPIPMIHCEKCGTVPVPYEDLPVKLPYDVDYRPKGTSPLGSNSEYINCKCPKCHGDAKRDPDTLDTFMCSSWYYLRYPNAKNSEEPFNTEWTNKILPVDKYVGGIEHACGHLLYSRFITKFLYDNGYINFDEPFLSLVHQGLILGSDGVKMSKSRGNTVSADEIISQYGSDILRMYLMFGFNYLEGGPWSYDGIAAINKFVDRLVRIVEKSASLSGNNIEKYEKDEKELEFVLNSSIEQINNDMEKFSFNTCVARVMEIVNQLYKYDAVEVKNNKVFKDAVYKLVLLTAPMIPHIAEEMFDILGGHKQFRSVFDEKYPVCDKTKLVKDEVEIAVQICNKIVARILVPNNAENSIVEDIVKAHESVIKALGGREIKKIIVIKNRLVNIIV
ncbi:MAG: leucine--tRNA ligase [Clostridiales bacterium]|nr:leucine--tRNA ligase [Candidatus Apopatousia equi]